VKDKSIQLTDRQWPINFILFTSSAVKYYLILRRNGEKKSTKKAANKFIFLFTSISMSSSGAIPLAKFMSCRFSFSFSYSQAKPASSSKSEITCTTCNLPYRMSELLLLLLFMKSVRFAFDRNAITSVRNLMRSWVDCCSS